VVNQGSDPGFVGDLLDYNKYVDLLLDLERVRRICDSEGFATKHFRDNYLSDQSELSWTEGWCDP